MRTVKQTHLMKSEMLKEFPYRKNQSNPVKFELPSGGTTVLRFLGLGVLL